MLPNVIGCLFPIIFLELNNRELLAIRNFKANRFLRDDIYNFKHQCVSLEEGSMEKVRIDGGIEMESSIPIPNSMAGNSKFQFRN